MHLLRFCKSACVRKFLLCLFPFLCCSKISSVLQSTLQSSHHAIGGGGRVGAPGTCPGIDDDICPGTAAEGVEFDTAPWPRPRPTNRPPLRKGLPPFLPPPLHADWPKRQKTLFSILHEYYKHVLVGTHNVVDLSYQLAFPMIFPYMPE